MGSLGDNPAQKKPSSAKAQGRLGKGTATRIPLWDPEWMVLGFRFRRHPHDPVAALMLGLIKGLIGYSDQGVQGGILPGILAARPLLNEAANYDKIKKCI